MQPMIWFIGVVEDIFDPNKVGRVRVRCLGYHTEDKNALKTKDLPWATVMQPTTSAAMQGIGSSPTGLVRGTHVVGFFRDGTDAQDPIVMGSLGGGSGQKPGGIYGFEDPFAMYPSEEKYSGHGLDEPDVNRLARNDDGQPHSAATMRQNSILKDIQIANSDTEAFNEPKTDYAPIYPYNNVSESESGHIHEVDDTPGKERILEQHRMGTFKEIHADGSQVVKVVADNYEFTLGDKYVHITGIADEEPDGSINQYKGNLHVVINGDVTEKINGNVERQIGGSVREIIKGNYTQAISGTYNLTVGTNAQIKVAADYTLKVEKAINAQAKNQFGLISEKANVTIRADLASVHLSANKNVSLIGQTGQTLIGAVDSATTTETSYLKFDTDGSLEVYAKDRIDVTAKTILDLNSGGGSPTSTNKINLN